MTGGSKAPDGGSLADFDEFAGEYEAKLADPWRGRFSGNADFFIHQKCRAMLRDIRRRGGRIDRQTRVLDVGCGTGTAMAYLRGTCTVLGCDVSREMLQRAPAGTVALQDAVSLPFQDGVFDVAFAMCVYHHIVEPRRLAHMREIVRVLKPGGLLFVFEHNPFNPVTQVVFRRAPVDRGWRMITPAALRGLFSRSGLTGLRTDYVLFLPERLSTEAVEDRLRHLPVGGQYYVVGCKAATA
jgi:SAM-dependent methyltransferase